MAKARTQRKTKSRAGSKTKPLKKTRTKSARKAVRRPVRKPAVRANKRMAAKAPHTRVYPVPAAVARRACSDAKKFRGMYERSVKNPDSFWAEQARQFVSWSKPWTRVSDWSF